VDMIVAGAPNQPGWKKYFGGSFVDEMLHMGESINILVVNHAKDGSTTGYPD